MRDEYRYLKRMEPISGSRPLQDGGAGLLRVCAAGFAVHPGLLTMTGESDVPSPRS